MKKIAVLLIALLLVSAVGPAFAAQSVGNKELVGNWLLQGMTGFAGDEGAASLLGIIAHGGTVVYSFDKNGALFQYLYVDDVLTKLEDEYFIDDIGIYVRSINASVPFRIENDALILYQENGEVAFARVEPEELPFVIDADENTIWGKWKLLNASGEGAEEIVQSLMSGTEHRYMFQNGMLFHAITEDGKEDIYCRGQYSVKENSVFLNDIFYAYFSVKGDTLYLYTHETRMMFSRIE